MTIESSKTVSVQEARAAGLTMLTTSDHPSGTVETVVGHMVWSRWCVREVDRLRAAGRRAEVVKGPDGKLAVWVSPPPPRNDGEAKSDATRS